ncbi:recombination protein NinB [Niveibacterium terrae]|uniref:recombination protein NinB n=1 Tax=Niveibacterium terrae TaxID=3373598 RepID=UPI003A8EB001
MTVQTIPLNNPSARGFACRVIQTAPEGYVAIIRERTRSLEQNARMWAQLEDISRQVDWYGQRLTKEEWKDVFSAALKRQKVVPGLDGGFVVCGQRTSKMGKREMSDLLELMNAFCAERGVKLSAPEWERDQIERAA